MKSRVQRLDTAVQHLGKSGEIRDAGHGDTGAGQLLAVKGRWLGDDTFEIVSHSVTEGTLTTTRLTFRGREVDATLAGNQGYSVRVHGQQGD